MTLRPVKQPQLLNFDIQHLYFTTLIRTLALVPQESNLNSNRTLELSICLGPQAGSKRVVLSECTVGQVEARVVTTVMVPSVEQTDTTHGQR